MWTAPSPSPLYPPPRVLREHRLAVTGGHTVHVQESGCADGIPALVLHGGPGSGCSPLLARYFDPARYRVICPDQRGAGRSRPAGGTRDNTLAHLLADLRALRTHLGVERWLVVGGSWGAALALVHAIDAPEAVAGLLLRSVFLARDQDVEAFFGTDTPDGAPAWTGPVQAGGAVALAARLARVFEHGSPGEQRELALRWWCRERERCGLPAAGPADAEGMAALVQRYRIQSHYLRHGCWLRDPPLLERCARLPPVPVLLLHGTEDAVCPPQGARELAQRVAHARLRWIDGAGHDPTHPAMAAAMVGALDRYAEHESLE